MKRLGIPHWHVVVSIEPAPMPDDHFELKGECFRKVNYNSAGITLNPEAFSNEEEVLHTLRHELFHCILAPIDILVNMLTPLLKADPIRQAMAESVRCHAVEKCVINLERMYLGLTKQETPTP
jgi:hypothetical protein